MSVPQLTQELRSRLSRNSFFVRAAVIFFAVLVLIFGIFLFVVLRREMESQHQRVDALNIERAKVTSVSTELVLEDLHQTMNQTLWDKDFIGAIVSPNHGDYDQTMRILTKLATIADNYSLVDRAFLYTSTDENLYSSGKSIRKVSESSEPIFRDFEQINFYAGPRLSGDDQAPFLISYEGQVYLCEHLYPDYIDSIGMIVFRLNLEDLNIRYGAAGGAEQDGCLVYTQDGSPVFREESREDMAAFALTCDAAAEGYMIDEEGLGYYYYCSSETGWIYFSPQVDGRDMEFDPVSILWIVAAAIAIGLAVSLAVAKQLNRPIRTLLEQVDTPTDSFDGSEIEYLTQSYHDTFKRNAELKATIGAITPYALERLFTNILSNRTPDPEQIRATIRSLNEPFSEGTHFLVLLAEMTGAEDAQLSTADSGLCMMKLRQTLAETILAKTRLYPVPRDDNYAAIVMAVEPGIGDEQIRSLAAEVARLLTTVGEQTPYRIRVGCGNIYNSINNICYSYKDAQEHLNRIRFFGGSSEDRKEDGPVQNRFFEDARQIIRLIQNRNEKEAEQYALSCIEKISAGVSDSKVMEKACREFTDTYLNIAEALDMGNVDDIRIQQKTMGEIVSMTGQLAVQVETMKNFMIRSIDILGRRTRSKSSWHIERIRDFISTNYSNSSLSLIQAAEHVGISPSYLSRLFKQELGASFVDYVNSVRVEEAKKLLRTTDMIIRDVAFCTGFNSEQNFYRIFKKLTNASPGEYRIWYMNQN